MSLIKSRFFFNISTVDIFKNIILKLFFNLKKKKIENQIKKKLKNYFPSSNFYFFSHGRSAFYFILINLKKKTSKRKIIINSFTLYEMINMIIYAGFIPVLIDLEKNSFETSIKKEIRKHQKDLAAIVITHLNGINRDVIEVKKFIKKKGIYLIEDAAVAFGSTINRKFAGGIGDYGIVSLNIMKNITTITGGILIDNNKKVKLIDQESIFKNEAKLDILKKSIFVLILQFLNSKFIFLFFYQFIKFSHKYKLNFFLKKYRTDFILNIRSKIPDQYLNLLSSVQTNVLCNQFLSLKKKQLNRIRKSKYYYDNLKKNNNILFPQKIFNYKNIFIDFPIIIKRRKKELFNYLMNNNIDVKGYYYSNCGNNIIYKKKCYISKINNSTDISKKVMMLPVNENFKTEDQDRVIFHINKFIYNNK